MHDELDSLHNAQQDDINSLLIHAQDRSLNFSSSEVFDLASHSMHAIQPSVVPGPGPPPPSHIPTLLSEFNSPEDIERMFVSSSRSPHSSQSSPSSAPSLTSSPVPISLHPQHPLSTNSPTSFVSSSSSLASALCPTTVGSSSNTFFIGGSLNPVNAPGSGSTSDLSDSYSSPNANGLYNVNVGNIAGNVNNGALPTTGSFSGSVSLASSVHDSASVSLSSSTSLSTSSSGYNFPTSSVDFNLISSSISHDNIATSKDLAGLLSEASSLTGNASESSNRTPIDPSRSPTSNQSTENDASFFHPFVNQLVETLKVARNSFSSMDIFDCVSTIEEGKQLLDKLKQLALHSHRGDNSEEFRAALENGTSNHPNNITMQNTAIGVSTTAAGLDILDAVTQQTDLQTEDLNNNGLLLTQQLLSDMSGDSTRKRCASSLAGDRVLKALKLEPMEEPVDLTDVAQAHNTLSIPMSVEIPPVPLPLGQQPLSIPMSIPGSEELLSSDVCLSVTDMLVTDQQQTPPSRTASQAMPLNSHTMNVPLSVDQPSMLQLQSSTIPSAVSSVPSTRPGSPVPVSNDDINMDAIRHDGSYSMSYMQLGNMPLIHSSSNVSSHSHSASLSALSPSSPTNISPTNSLPITSVHSQAHSSTFSPMDGTMSYDLQTHRPSRPMRSASLSYPFDPTSQEYPIPRDFQYTPGYMGFDFNSPTGLQLQSSLGQTHASQAQIAAYGRRASASVSGPMSTIPSSIGGSELRQVRSRTLITQAPGSIGTSNNVSPTGITPVSSYRSPSGSADELDEGYDNGDYDSDGAESGEIWYTSSPIYSNGAPSMSMFGVPGSLEGITQTQQSELSRVGIIGQNGHYGHGIDAHDKVQSELDVIFFEFMNRICSNLDATDNKGELIHQTLMAKKMQRLDESPDFRPFKFRIQAFTNAFLEELARKGFPEDKIPMKKVRNYLWNQPYISRFNEDGKKAKSKGNHIWHVDAKKKPEGGWEFRPFHRKFAGAHPAMAYIGARWSWSPRVWDPQSARPNMPVHFSSPALPPWLQWVDGTLTGTPPPDAQSCDIAVEARFMQDGREELLSQVFHISVGNMMQSLSANLDNSYSVQVARRPSLSGDPRRINSDPVVQQASGAVPRFVTMSQSVVPPVATSSTVTEVPGQPMAIMTGALESVTQKVHAGIIHSVGNTTSSANKQIEQLVKQKHVLEVTASVMDPKPQIMSTVTQPATLKAVAEHVVLLATQKVEVDHSTAAAISSFSTGIPQSTAPPPPLITEISAATESAVAQAVEITGPLSSEIDVMKTAGSLLEHQRALQDLDIIPVSVASYSMIPAANQGQPIMSQIHMNTF